MKKTFLILTIALLSFAATYVIAQSANGQNWVGYVKVPAPPASDLELIGVNFEAVGSENGGIPLNELLNTNNLIGGFRAALRDKVFIWDQAEQGYVSYTYDAGDFHDGDVVTNPVVFAGDALWLRSAPSAAADRDLYALGQVDLSTNAPITYSEGLQLCSYPYPSDMVFSNIDWLAEGASTGFRPAMRDKVYVFVGGGYESYSLQEDGTWEDGAGDDGLVIGAGEAFWYLARATYTNNFVRPFDID